MKLDQDDVDRICKRVVDYHLDTQFVAEQFDISRRRVQQLAKAYRESGEIPTLDTPGRKPYRTYPDDLIDRILELYNRFELGATAIAHILRVRDDLAIDNNRVHTILKEYDNVTENPNKQGRKRPWVRWEREYSLVTVHMDWFHNSREQWCLAVQDDASRLILDMIETDRRSTDRSVELLDSVRDQYTATGEILEVITDHGSEFYAPRRDADGEAAHAFEAYLDEHGIKQTLCAVGRPQTNGKIERFFQTYEKQRWRFPSLERFLDFYNKERPHMSLNWDELETPYEAFDRLLPTEDDAAALVVVNGGDHATK